MAKRSEQFVIPPIDYVLVSSAAPTAGDDIILPAGCRGLLIGTAGALNVTMANGNERDGVPMFAGQMPGFFGVIRTDAGNTAANIWAIV